MYPCKNIIKMSEPSEGPAENFTFNEEISLSLPDQNHQKKHNWITLGFKLWPGKHKVLFQILNFLMIKKSNQTKTNTNKQTRTKALDESSFSLNCSSSTNIIELKFPAKMPRLFEVDILLTVLQVLGRRHLFRIQKTKCVSIPPVARANMSLEAPVGMRGHAACCLSGASQDTFRIW